MKVMSGSVPRGRAGLEVGGLGHRLGCLEGFFKDDLDAGVHILVLGRDVQDLVERHRGIGGYLAGNVLHVDGQFTGQP